FGADASRAFEKRVDLPCSTGGRATCSEHVGRDRAARNLRDIGLFRINEVRAQPDAVADFALELHEDVVARVIGQQVGDAGKVAKAVIGVVDNARTRVGRCENQAGARLSSRRRYAGGRAIEVSEVAPALGAMVGRREWAVTVV